MATKKVYETVAVTLHGESMGMENGTATKWQLEHGDTINDTGESTLIIPFWSVQYGTTAESTEEVDMTDDFCKSGGDTKCVTAILFPDGNGGNIEISTCDFTRCEDLGGSYMPVLYNPDLHLEDGQQYGYGGRTYTVGGGILQMGYDWHARNAENGGVEFTWTGEGASCDSALNQLVTYYTNNPPSTVIACEILTTIPHAQGTTDISTCALKCMDYSESIIAYAELPSSAYWLNGATYDYSYVENGETVSGTTTCVYGSVSIPSDNPVISMNGSQRRLTVSADFSTCEEAKQHAIELLGSLTMTVHS